MYKHKANEDCCSSDEKIVVFLDSERSDECIFYKQQFTVQNSVKFLPMLEMSMRENHNMQRK